jgi:hypothetical protein
MTPVVQHLFSNFGGPPRCDVDADASDPRQSSLVGVKVSPVRRNNNIRTLPDHIRHPSFQEFVDVYPGVNICVRYRACGADLHSCRRAKHRTTGQPETSRTMSASMRGAPMAAANVDLLREPRPRGSDRQCDRRRLCG